MSTLGKVHVDRCGRVLIPQLIRRQLNLRGGARLDFKLEGDRIAVTPRQESCVFCPRTEALQMYGGKLVCHKCVDGIVTGRRPTTV